MPNRNTSHTPPRWLDLLLEWFCSDEFLEIVQGDLHEIYRRNVREKGRKKANLLYLRDVLDLFRPFVLGFSAPHFQLTTSGMYKNYFITALRNFRRHFGFSIINILGLAIGMAAFMIILTYVSYEVSYDDYHQNKNQLYRWKTIPLKDRDGEIWFETARSVPVLSSFIKDNMPEVKEVARLHHCPFQNPYITISHTNEENNRTSFNEEHAYFADASFLTMLNIQMLTGDSLALSQPNSIIISETTATRYFGHSQDDILGQFLEVPYLASKLETQYMVTGIFQDLPPNTHLQMDILLSYSTLSEHDSELFEDGWLPISVYTYLQLYPQVSEAQFLQKRNQYTTLLNQRHQVERIHNKSLWFEYDLLPIDEIYFRSKTPKEIRSPGDKQSVYQLLGIGLLVIVIAWVNYINLTTAKAVQRAKEVGVRKVAGAGRSQLIQQFLSESLVINLLSVMIAMLIIWLSLPYFQQLTEKPLSFHLWHNGLPDQRLFLTGMVVLLLISTLLSGIYPALILSSYQPLKILRGRLLHLPSRNLSLRSGLVIFQFVVSIVLIAGTYSMYRQIHYMQNQHLGFDVNQMMIINSPTDDSLKSIALEGFKNDLLAQAFVEGTTTSSMVPGRRINWGGGIGTNPENLTHKVENISIDYNFLEIYDFQFIAGRNFSEDYSTDRDAVIITASTAEMLGFVPAETALHQRIWVDAGGMSEVIGIVENFHQTSLKEEYGSVNFILENPYDSYLDKSASHNDIDKDRAFLSLKINTTHLSKNVGLIEKKWHTYFSGYPFDYFFLNEYFNQQYRADIRFGRVFGIFAGLAIFIACLGILGLSSYLAVQKSKEIGIRKVLGATVSHIVLLLSGKFIRLVLLATLVALPLAYFVADRWLESYAFRIEIGWWFFVIPAVAVLLIAVWTISVQTIKAALTNPVDSLKYE